MSEKLFLELSDIKNHYSIEAEVSLGDSGYVKYLETEIIVSNEGSPAYVQIGKASGATFNVNDYLASKADYVLGELQKYIEHGDHDGVYSACILVVDGKYRLHVIFDNDEMADNGLYETDKDTLESAISALNEIA